MSESTRRVHGKGATGTQELDVLIIGGGQSGLATAYYVRKATDNYLVLDNQERPGGAWLHAWDSMTLFSASSFSNLPGYPMPSTPGYPSRDHVIDYLTEYERRYALPVVCPVEVTDIAYSHARFTVNNRWSARELIGATGTWSSPFVPHYPGTFRGTQWHSGTYPGPEPFAGTSVAVVGGGNSAAQIAAELSSCTEVTWYTRRPLVLYPTTWTALSSFTTTGSGCLRSCVARKIPAPTVNWAIS